MPIVAIKGSTTSHGGTITTGSGDGFAKAAVARVGDTHVCPVEGHGTNSITQGSGTVSLDGKAVARVGDLCGCGATISTGDSKVIVG